MGSWLLRLCVFCCVFSSNVSLYGFTSEDEVASELPEAIVVGIPGKQWNDEVHQW